MAQFYPRLGRKPDPAPAAYQPGKRYNIRMTLRAFLERHQRDHTLAVVSNPISKKLDIAAVLHQVEPRPVLFANVKESSFRVAGNLFCTKQEFAAAFELQPSQLIPAMMRSIDQRSAPAVIDRAPCQDVVNLSPDLDELPILFHCDRDGGNYISSGVVISRSSRWGLNADFHRCMQISKNQMAVRVVRGRHFDAFLNEDPDIPVAICIGCPPNLLAAAATSVDLGTCELEIANTLAPLPLVPAKTVNVLVPAECEFVIEGIVHRDQTHAEGPFVDLTETFDVIRDQPILEVTAVTHRLDAIWHALLPGGLEHKLLMGMPREPTIFRKVNEVVRCLDVNVNPGGCSWLHAIVQIDKQNEDDGLKAIEAAFDGHRSCKHVFVVDSDIDIYDPAQVEWAMATRFQGNRGLIIHENQPGSSLDPSSQPGTHLTTKVGFDLTRQLSTRGKDFNRAAFPAVDLSRFGL